MLLKACARCGNLIPYGAIYCEKCGAIVQAEKVENKKGDDSRYNKGRRDPEVIRFYNSSAWKSLALTYTQDRGYKCEECGKIATEVHHIIPIQTPEGWKRRLDYDNLELLCKDCHNKKHNRFQSRKSRQKQELEKRFEGGFDTATPGGGSKSTETPSG